MSAYKELLAQQAELDRKIEAARREEVAAAIQMIRECVIEYKLSEDEVMRAVRGEVRASGQTREVKKVEPKYRDPETGATWTGRGKAPRWIEGKDRDAFLI